MYVLHTDGYAIFHVVLSGIFTVVCAFRSIFPRVDLERYCIVDSCVSSMVIGRSAATVAEISFATQIGLIMHEIGGAAGCSWVQSLTLPVIPYKNVERHTRPAEIYLWVHVTLINPNLAVNVAHHTLIRSYDTQAYTTRSYDKLIHNNITIGDCIINHRPRALLVWSHYTQ